MPEGVSGAESFDQRTLDYYHKATTVEMNQRAVVAFDAAGIAVVCGYIIGAPHDTVESILADLERALTLPIYFLAAAILTPDIGTTEFRRAVRRMIHLRVLVDEAGGLSVRPRPDLFGTQAPYGMPTVSEAVSKTELDELRSPSIARSACAGRQRNEFAAIQRQAVRTKPWSGVRYRNNSHANC